MKPINLASPSASPVIVPVNDAHVPSHEKDSAELPTEKAKPPEETSEKVKKPRPVYGRPMSDAEYEEIFDAVLNYVEPIQEDVEETEGSEEVEEKQYAELTVYNETPAVADKEAEQETEVDQAATEDPFDAIIADGKEIDALCKLADSEEEGEKDESSDKDEDAEEDKDEEEEVEVDVEAEDEAEEMEEEEENVEPRHVNESTPCSSDSELSNQESADSSSCQPPQPKKKSFRVKPKSGKFTPKKLNFPPKQGAEKNDKSTKEKPDGKPQSLFTSKEEKKRRPSRRDWMKKRPIELIGTWVQCSDVTCLKWRYLSYVQDPAELPEYWTCNLNTDTMYDSCDKAEQEYTEDQHVFTKYTEGSIVWANMAGYPWWPAMVEVDPDFEIFAECRFNPKEISHVHVVFFDEKVTRAWVRTSQLKSFARFTDHCGPTKSRGYNYRKEIEVAKDKASYALGLTIKERLEEFSFAKRFNGRWGKTGDRLYKDAAKPGTSKARRGRKRKTSKSATTSTPKSTVVPIQGSMGSNISLDSELAEFRDLEGAIDAILETQDEYDSFDDEIFSDCDENELETEVKEKTKKRKLVLSPDLVQPKKQKKEKSEKKDKSEKKEKDSKKKEKKEKVQKKEKVEKKEKSEKKEKKEKSSEKKEKCSEKEEKKEKKKKEKKEGEELKTRKKDKSAAQPVAPKQKPVFAAPKKPGKEFAKPEKTPAKTLGELHIIEKENIAEKQKVLKRAFKPKSVVLKSANLSENKVDASQNDENDPFNKLDSEIFTMELGTDPLKYIESKAESDVTSVANEGKSQKKDSAKISKKKKVDSEGENKDGEPKVKKKKSESKKSADCESESGPTKVKKAPKKKKPTQNNKVSVETEIGTVTIKVEKEDDSYANEAEKSTQPESSENAREAAEGNTSSEATNEIGETAEVKKESNLPKEKGNTGKSNLTQSKKAAGEGDGPSKKKFSAPVAKAKKGFQAPVMGKKESKPESKPEGKKESKPKNKPENKKEKSESKKANSNLSSQKETSPKSKEGSAATTKDNETTAMKTKETTEKDEASTPRTETDDHDESLESEVSKHDEESEIFPETSTNEKTEKDDTPVAPEDGSDDEMMLDLMVDAANDEDAKDVKGAMDTEDGVDANPGVSNSQASAGSGYESDLFESEM